MDLYLDSLLFTFDVIIPVFLVALLGYTLKRLEIIGEVFVENASNLVFLVTMPILIFMSIALSDIHATLNLDQIAYVTIGTLAVFFALWLAGRIWISAPEDLGVFIQGSLRSNYGIFGLALSFSLFSDSGIAQASILLAVIIPLFNILSIVALTIPQKGRGINSLYKVFIDVVKSPLILAVILALPFAYFGIQLPKIVQSTGNYFANLTLPIALLAIGASIDPEYLKKSPKVLFWATASKLIFVPLIMTLLAFAYGFRGQDLAMLMILFACPTPAVSFMMAKSMGGNSELAASIVLMTTVGSVFTLSTGIYILSIFGIV
ncbi:MAG: AEC family transporter [Neptuniibacter sp.]